MAAHISPKLNEEACPITEQFLGQLRQAAPPDAVEIAKTLPESQRARLALFFYNRSHLHCLGRMIASSCDRQALVHAGGRLGEMIFDQSRDAEVTASSERRLSGMHPRKPITLAGPKLG